MEVEIISLSGVVFQGLAAELQLTTEAGEISVLPRHEELLTVLKPGPLHVVVREGGKAQTYASFGGVADITPDGVRVLVDELEHVDSLIEDEIESALAEAEHLEATAENVHQQVQASRNIVRHTARLRTVRRHRPRA